MFQERGFDAPGVQGEFALGGTRLRLRGPDCDPSRPFVMCLGGAETRAEATDRPFSSLCAHLCGVAVLNAGVDLCGPGLVADHPALADRVRNARDLVVGPLPVDRLSNRFYRVHRLHNDRVIGVSAPLRLLFHDLDFGDTHYVGHLHLRLRQGGSERYGIVLDELRRAWTARIAAILALTAGRTVFVLDRSARDAAGTTLQATPALVAGVAPDGPVVTADTTALARGDRLAHRRLAEELAVLLSPQRPEPRNAKGLP